MVIGSYFQNDRWTTVRAQQAEGGGQRREPSGGFGGGGKKQKPMRSFSFRNPNLKLANFRDFSNTKIKMISNNKTKKYISLL